MATAGRSGTHRLIALGLALVLAGCAGPSEPSPSSTGFPHESHPSISIMELPPSRFTPPHFENVSRQDLEEHAFTWSEFETMRSASAPSRGRILDPDEASVVEEEILSLQTLSPPGTWTDHDGLFQFRIEGEDAVYRYAIGVVTE